MRRSNAASSCASTSRRAESASCQSTISCAPRQNGMTARYSGTRAFTFVLSKITECALSPMRPGPHAGMARAKQIELSVAASRTPIVTDPLRVRQILTNLISNAIKYSPHGGRVEMRLVSSEGVERISDCVGVEVRDSGPGIPVELQSKVFQEFFRVRAGDDAPSGNGLGLAISRRVAQLLGGDVRFIEAESGGAVFTLWLPSKRSAERSGSGHREVDS